MNCISLYINQRDIENYFQTESGANDFKMTSPIKKKTV